jgi:hypothetical protein
MLKKIWVILTPKKFLNKLTMKYEDWIIPPQNESLIELKRREFKERTKYLDPKILYGLTQEEKNELRDQGYFVDLDKKTIEQIKNFSLTYNRHTGRYKILSNNYNFAMYNTQFYYADQNVNNFMGDPLYHQKVWRMRSRNKPKMVFAIFLICFVYLHYHYKIRRHRKHRNMGKKIAQTNPEKILKAPFF